MSKRKNAFLRQHILTMTIQLLALEIIQSPKKLSQDCNKMNRFIMILKIKSMLKSYDYYSMYYTSLHNNYSKVSFKSYSSWELKYDHTILMSVLKGSTKVTLLKTWLYEQLHSYSKSVASIYMFETHENN